MGILQVSVKPTTTSTRPLYSKITRMRRLSLLLVFLAALIQYCGAAERQNFEVNVAFICDHEEYTPALTNHSSPEFKEMAEHIREDVHEGVPPFKEIKVDRFSEGPDGTVKVHARITVKKRNQKQANRFVKRRLRKAGFPNDKKQMTPTLEIDSESVSVGVRLCVAGQQESNECSDMKDADPGLDIICVEARDRSECLQWVEEDLVDVVPADGEDIYHAIQAISVMKRYPNRF